jgi:hypothetical protein
MVERSEKNRNSRTTGNPKKSQRQDVKGEREAQPQYDKSKEYQHADL